VGGGGGVLGFGEEGGFLGLFSCWIGGGRVFFFWCFLGGVFGGSGGGGGGGVGVFWVRVWGGGFCGLFEGLGRAGFSW